MAETAAWPGLGWSLGVVGCAWVGEDPCTDGDGLPGHAVIWETPGPQSTRYATCMLGTRDTSPAYPHEETLAGERNTKETGVRWVQVEGGYERAVPANLLAWLKPVGCSQDRPPTQPQSAGPAAVGRADLRTAGFGVEKETAFCL